MVHNQERLDAAEKCVGKNSSQSGHDGLRKTKAKRGTKFGKLLANLSFGKNAGQKKQQKKVPTSDISPLFMYSIRFRLLLYLNTF